MNEELKVIIELLQGAGVGTMWVAFGYMVWKLLLMAICWIGGTFIVKIVIQGIKSVVATHPRDNTNKAVWVVRELRSLLHIGYDGHLTEEEITQVRDKIVRLIQGENQ